jgi:hypothetical protein
VVLARDRVDYDLGKMESFQFIQRADGWNDRCPSRASLCLESHRGCKESRNRHRPIRNLFEAIRFDLSVFS